MTAVALRPVAVPPSAVAGAEAPVVVRVSDISLRIPVRKGAPLHVLDGVDLAVRDREFVSLVGPSGCGKSTLLNFVAGLARPPAGRVGIASGDTGVARSIGYMFQQHGLLPWRTVQKNVELGLEIAGVSRERRATRAASLLAELGLSGFGNHYPAEISGGMRQRAALARTLAADPDLLLMDEPFGALDAQTKILVQALFSDYWERYRKTVLFVTHDLEEAITLSDRVLVMSARPGRIIAEFGVDIPRPRDFDHIRATPRFAALLDAIWGVLREQAVVAMAGRA